MKRLATLLLIAALLTGVTAALAEQPSPEAAAYSIVPKDAELLRTEKDDGLLEFMFQTPDGTRYQVNLHPETLKIFHVEKEAPGKHGGSSALLTKEQAEKALMEHYPQATITFTTAGKEDGGHVYQIRFRTDDLIGKAEVNAETGAIVELELDYIAVPAPLGALTEDGAKELALSLVENGRITEFEIEREDGRTEYQGEVLADGILYEFVIDAETGAVVEWHRD